MASSFHLRQAAQILRNGGVIGYPTEAVYGLGCDPLNEQAVMRLLTLKHRPVEKGLILIAADFNQLTPYLARLEPEILAKVQQSWPGPFTWVIPARDDVPDWVSGRHDSIAVRVTAHPVAAAICRAFGGAIVSTSANKSAHPPARTALKARIEFSNQLDYLITGATGRLATPTIIRDAYTDQVIRA